MSDPEIPPVVVDSGSGSFKVGLAWETEPFVFSPTVGRPKHSSYYQMFSWMLGCRNKSHYVGNIAEENRGVLALNYPIQRGMITNWDDYEQVWRYIYDDVLMIPPEERPVLLTEAPFNSVSQREKLGQIMFEKFQVPALGLALSAMLSMYTLGRTTGTVLDCGEGVTYTVPVYEGAAIPRAIVRFPHLVGSDLSDRLFKLLTDRDPHFTTKADRNIVREIKEQHCYVALNFQREVAAAVNTPKQFARTYQLPDGKNITVGSERFLCPEVLFQPPLFGMECRGVHEGLLDSISKCPEYLRQDLYSTVVLCGGTTKLPGMAERLRKELVTSFKISGIPKLLAVPDCSLSAWRGGSVLASMSNFERMCVSKQEYEEFGGAAIHQVMGPI